MSGEDRLNFLATLAQAKDELENIVLTVDRFGKEETQMFMDFFRTLNSKDLAYYIGVAPKCDRWL